MNGTDQPGQMILNRRWFAEKVAAEQGPLFFAVAPSTNPHANPANIEHMFSATLRQGFRTFAFPTKDARSVFLARCPEAQTIVDPMK